MIVYVSNHNIHVASSIITTIRKTNMSSGGPSSLPHSTPQQKTSRPSRNLASCSFQSALAYDPRPTFVLSIELATPYISYSNPALHSRPNLHKAVGALDFSLGRENTSSLILYGEKWDRFTIDGKLEVFSTVADIEDLQGLQRGDEPRHPTPAAGKSLVHMSKDAIPTTSKLDVPAAHEQFISLFDWKSLEVGPLDAWPPRLLDAFITILVDPRPACLFWGEDFLLLYNVAQIEMMGDKHPKAQGLAIDRVFPETWETFDKPGLAHIRTMRCSLRQSSRPFAYLKDGDFLEERVFDWIRMPVLDESFAVEGIMQSLTDVTATVVKTRRSLSLSALIGIITQGQTYNTWERIMEKLANNVDLPQALLYSHSKDPIQTQVTCKMESSLRIKQSIGLESFALNDPNHRLAKIFRHCLTLDRPLYLSRRRSYGKSDLWLQTARDDVAYELSALLDNLLKDFESSSVDAASDSIVVFPIWIPQSQETCGFALFGLNPRYPYDLAYQDYICLMQNVISSTITSSLLWRADRLSSREMTIKRTELRQVLTSYC